tara:strand:+ start:345 stop:605 length:261 start_codon:yes stop_codon:yes gene_type:complete
MIGPNLSFGRSKYLRIGCGFGLKMPEINKSLTSCLDGKRLGISVLIELEGPIFLIGIAGSRGVDNKGAVSNDVVKHDLNNTSLVKK